MKLSIGITFCDKDYQFYDRVLQQIKERVKIEHEIIVIDNTEGNKLGDKATFAFGYNAYQFAARYKIIKLAKGEYLWFIDGDDTIYDVEEVLYDDDIISFALNYEERKDKVYYSDFFSWDFIQEVVKQALWNKFIRRSLYDEIDKYIPDPLVKIVTLEDTFYVALALKHAKTVRLCEQVIYCHWRGISDALEITPEKYDNLITGYHNVVELFGGIGFDKDYILRNHFKYLISFIPKCSNPGAIIDRIMTLYPDKENWVNQFYKLIGNADTQDEYNLIRDAFIKHFGKESIPLKSYYTINDDGAKTEVKFEQTIVFKEWKHNLSIICLVYDGNQDCLKSFVDKVHSRVKVDYEIVIVDNRDNKELPLDYEGKANVVVMNHNVGIMDGRRAGVNAAKNDYVWMVDIDDEPLLVKPKNYSDSDVIVFPAYYEEGETVYKGKIPSLLRKEDYFKTNTLNLIAITVWNKWVKREVAVAAYADIPTFFCIFNEDNNFYYAMLKHCNSISMVRSRPLYARVKSKSSVTTAYINTKAQIDRMFIGYEESTKWQREYMKDYPKISFENPYNIVFYLWIMNKTDDTLKQYFADTLITVFTKEEVVKAINVSLKDSYEEHILWARKILPYFQ